MEDSWAWTMGGGLTVVVDGVGMNNGRKVRTMVLNNNNKDLAKQSSNSEIINLKTVDLLMFFLNTALII